MKIKLKSLRFLLALICSLAVGASTVGTMAGQRRTRASSYKITTRKPSSPTAVVAATPTPPPGSPRYAIYMSPPGVGDSAGEPSIGSNWTKEAISHNHNVDGSINNIPNGGTSLYFGGFLASMLVLAGAEWAARGHRIKSLPEIRNAGCQSIGVTMLGCVAAAKVKVVRCVVF